MDNAAIMNSTPRLWACVRILDRSSPNVPNLAPKGPGKGMALEPGVVLAVEPMVTLGSAAVEELDDGWTVVTRDGSQAAHWEHTVAVTPEGPWVLTALDGGAARLGR